MNEKELEEQPGTCPSCGSSNYVLYVDKKTGRIVRESCGDCSTGHEN